MKYLHTYILFAMLGCHSSCTGQSKPTAALSQSLLESKDTATSYDPKAMVRNVKQSRNGDILIAASFSGIYRYDGKSFTNLSHKIGRRRFWDVMEDRHGNIWIATTDSGVYKYDGKSFEHFTQKVGLVSNSVFSIYEDRAGIMWFGTGGGASRYDGKTFQNYTTKEGLSNNGVHTIMEDKFGRLWFGTSGEACYFDGTYFTVFRNQDGKAFTNVWSIIEDSKDNIWFGASVIDSKKGDTVYVSNGLWRYDGNTFTKVAQQGASAIMEDKEGNIWTNGPVNPNGVGLWTFSRYDHKSLYDKQPKVNNFMSIKKMLCGILEAKDGSIWFGSINGVYRFDSKKVIKFSP
jgi:ligand-binding sensor domain-containing protein